MITRLLMFIIFSPLYMYSQKDTSIRYNEIFKNRVHIQPQISFSLYNRANIIQSEGSGILTSKIKPSLSVSLILCYSINKNFALNTGIKWGMIPIDYGITLNKDKYLTPYNETYSDYFLEIPYSYFSIPVSLKYRHFFKKVNFMEYSVGIGIKYIIDGFFNGGVDFYNANYLKLIDIQMYSNKEKKISPDILFDIKYNKLLKNNNYISFGISLDYSIVRTVNGTFSFYNIGANNGKIYQSSSNFNFNVAYAFSFTKKSKVSNGRLY